MLTPKRLTLFGALLLLIISQSSCITTKQTRYLQGVGQSGNDSFHVELEKRSLLPNDYINIIIKSIDPKYDQLFTIAAPTFNNFNSDASDIFYLSGYHIDDSGYVILPVLGKIQVAWRTLEEAEKILQAELQKYISIIFVTVKVGGIRYSIIGEVRSPGKYTILQNNVTIFEAISRAGDLTDFAKRNEIVIVRRVSNNNLKIIKVNLLDGSALNNFDYYIHSDDIIYVMPLKVKQVGIGANGYQVFSSVVAVITSSLGIYALFFK